MDKSLEESVNCKIRTNIVELKNTYLVEETEFNQAYANIEGILDVAMHYFKVKKEDHASVADLWQCVTSQYFHDTLWYMQTYGYAEVTEMNLKQQKSYFNRILKKYGGKENEQKT